MDLPLEQPSESKSADGVKVKNGSSRSHSIKQWLHRMESRRTHHLRLCTRLHIVQRCAITDRKRLIAAAFSDPSSGRASSPSLSLRAEREAAARLRALAAGWMEGGVDFIQLREKDLDPPALISLMEEIFRGLDRRSTRLLVNVSADQPPRSSPFPERAYSDLAARLEPLAPFADGVHLPGRPSLGAVREVRRVFRAQGRHAVVSLICHSLEEIGIAQEERPDFILFAPVFEKEGVRPGTGLPLLRMACRAAGEVPVLALGGVTAENAPQCVAAGAAGIAGIRLFTGDSWRRL